jgi:excisionase family DNA binding protein
MDSKPLLAKEVANELRCSQRQVYDLFDEGQLEGYRIGRAIRIHAWSVNDFIDRNSNKKAPVALDPGLTFTNTLPAVKPLTQQHPNPPTPQRPTKGPVAFGLRHLRL